MHNWNDIQHLAALLRQEWEGAPIDKAELRDLARRLLPHHPEIRSTLTHIDKRLSHR